MNIFKTKYRIVEDQWDTLFIQKRGWLSLWIWAEVDDDGRYCFLIKETDRCHFRCHAFEKSRS